MKLTNQARAFYGSLILACVPLLYGGFLLWYVNRPQYLVFSTGPVGQSHTVLDLYYPADWTPAHLQSTYAWNYTSVTLERRPPVGLGKWIDEHIYHITSQDWKNSTIRVQLMEGPGQVSSDIDTEERRLRRALDQLARTGNKYSLQRVDFAAGPALVFEINSRRAVRPLGASFYNSIIFFPRPAPGRGRSEIAVAYSVPESLKGRMRQTAFEIITHLRLVEKK